MDDSIGLTHETGDELNVAGRNVACPICGHGRFTERRSLLNTRLATLFNVDWANKEAHNYICTQCGHILWFLAE